jgi:hypothetical protein
MAQELRFPPFLSIVYNSKYPRCPAMHVRLFLLVLSTKIEEASIWQTVQTSPHPAPFFLANLTTVLAPTRTSTEIP